MRRLTQQSQNLAQGELDTPFQWEDDEIGKLDQNLEAAREALREQVNSLAQKNLKLETELIDRKQIESALVANQNRYRHLVENTTVILGCQSDGMAIHLRRPASRETARLPDLGLVQRGVF